MRQLAVGLILSAVMAGCTNFETATSPEGPNPGAAVCGGSCGRSNGPPVVKAVVDPYGNPVPMIAPYSSSPPPNDWIARNMLAYGSQPLDKVQFNSPAAMNQAMMQAGAKGGMPTPVPPGGLMTPPGGMPGMGFSPSMAPPKFDPKASTSGVVQAAYNPGTPTSYPQYGYPYGAYPYPYYPQGYYPQGYYPPSGYPPSNYPAAGYPPSGYPQPSYPPSGAGNVTRAQYMPGPAGPMPAQPGMQGGMGAPMPGGMGGPMPGVMGGPMPPGMMPTQMTGCPPMMGGPPCFNPAAALANAQRTQVNFNRPIGMKVNWFVMGPDGRPMYSTTPIETPGSYNFIQGAIYRLKLTNIEEQPELTMYPTMEIFAGTTKTQEFLAHSGVPVQFTSDDFKQAKEGNYVVKVIYLPDPQFQDVAGTGTDEILSTRLDPGTDPIQEARRKGTPMIVIRMGNVQQELDHTPPLGAAARGPAVGIPGPQGAYPLPNLTPKPLTQVPYYWPYPGPYANGSGANPGCPPQGCPPQGCPPGYGMPAYGIPGCPPGYGPSAYPGTPPGYPLTPPYPGNPPQLLPGVAPFSSQAPAAPAAPAAPQTTKESPPAYLPPALDITVLPPAKTNPPAPEIGATPPSAGIGATPSELPSPLHTSNSSPEQPLAPPPAELLTDPATPSPPAPSTPSAPQVPAGSAPTPPQVPDGMLPSVPPGIPDAFTPPTTLPDPAALQGTQPGGVVIPSEVPMPAPVPQTSPAFPAMPAVPPDSGAKESDMSPLGPPAMKIPTPVAPNPVPSTPASVPPVAAPAELPPIPPLPAFDPNTIPAFPPAAGPVSPPASLPEPSAVPPAAVPTPAPAAVPSAAVPTPASVDDLPPAPPALIEAFTPTGITVNDFFAMFAVFRPR